ncbi:hypothetical protein [Anaerocolumna xylanovorans]|uniref:Uncharacterized protein n=1 Tax=Anaerocolumna xylanovorans DSM 12503 TaxID=1121345 RepID=A0A1M7Y3R0_9FIRM|nr:hypothetical protein [Anaerocolumna xylanovorans]SHO46848.1 hypothetical protein SAMN02745217_01310 [Anaerocolumna xylanovorans DSM 12503]
MKIVINNVNDGMRLAADICNQLIAEALYQRVIGEAEPDRYVVYEQLISYIEELSRDCDGSKKISKELP